VRSRVLVIDDDGSLREMLGELLTQRGFEITSCGSADDALRVLTEQEFDVVVTDVNMPAMTGGQLCRRIVANREDLPVVLMTAFGSMAASILAIRAGAYDFVTKPIDLDELVLILERAQGHRSLRGEVKRISSAPDDARRFDEILGACEPMKKIYDLIARVAKRETGVLITGESGTGKELVARALHLRSPRRDGPFIAINCAALPESLLESELFGHVKGAFTDAGQTRTGLFVQASRGTLFLDEIGDMPLRMQTKLLRALQERTVRPVGGDGEVSFDTRVLAATNRDLETEVEEKRFREDLFYRINVVRIHVPPLRVRGSDIILLAQHYLNRYLRRGKAGGLGMSSAAADKLLGYPWPGNVRELQNCIQGAVALAPLDEIDVDDLPERVRAFKPPHVLIEGTAPVDLLTMNDVERRHVLRVLDAVAGNKSIAAKVLGLDRRTLYRKLAAYGPRSTLRVIS
jgi:DNA-binding NtrC family response regulator